MIKEFNKDFSIRIDVSDCKSIIAGYDANLNDTWRYSDQTFESGKIYGLVSEHGQGCEYLSYLLGGRVKFDNVKVYCNDNLISQDDLKIITVLDIFPVPLFHADTLKIIKILIFQNIFLKSCNTL